MPASARMSQMEPMSTAENRSGAGTGAETLTMAPKGAEVTVEEDAGDGWYKVTYGDTEGHLPASARMSQMEPMSTAENRSGRSLFFTTRSRLFRSGSVS